MIRFLRNAFGLRTWLVLLFALLCQTVGVASFVNAEASGFSSTCADFEVQSEVPSEAVEESVLVENKPFDLKPKKLSSYSLRRDSTRNQVSERTPLRPPQRG